MYVHRRRTRIEIWTPAKLNLYLEVLGRRADGYHEIETLMVPIGLFDTLQVSQRADSQITLSADWAGPSSARGSDGSTLWGELPPARENLAYRAVERLRERAGVTAGIDLRLIKRIPAAAGLGGGSSDAAAALWGAHRLWGLDWSAAQLAELAGELGSDVPFFLSGSAAWCRGRGERIEPFALGVRPHFVILRPPAGLSTAAVYAETELSDSPRSAGCGWPREAVRCSSDLARHLFNRLQAAAERVAPWMSQVQQHFERLDFLGHQMSGSGSAYFGVCRSARHARRLASVLRARCAGCLVRAVTAIGGQHRVLPVGPN
jgi:4-diphosphocytidyl-2-C-methyl-D-erythritol kinase